MARRGGNVDFSSSAFRRHSRNAKKQMAEIQKRLEAELAKMENVTEDTIRELGAEILERSQQLVPVDTGDLKGSAFQETSAAAGSVQTTVGYNADGSAPHAVFAHEIGPYANPTTPGTQYKFLETAANETSGDIPRTLQRRLQR